MVRVRGNGPKVIRNASKNTWGAWTRSGWVSPLAGAQQNFGNIDCLSVRVIATRGPLGVVCSGCASSSLRCRHTVLIGKNPPVHESCEEHCVSLIALMLATLAT